LGPRASRLLPQANPGWRQAAAAVHRQKFQAIAAARGISYSEFNTYAAGWLQAQVGGCEVRLRMRIAHFESFLASGQYLTQFALPYSGGLKHRGIRMMLEHTVLGVSPSCRPLDRPIYGYLSGSDETGQVQQYGEIVLRLAPHLRNRATFVMGDSLDHSIHHFRDPPFVPQPIVHPTTLAFQPIDMTTAASLGDAAPPYGYAEAQLHGGLTPEDVSEAVYTLGTAPTPATEDLLGRLGVQWHSTTAFGP
jgi:hypothetical protein